MLTDNWRDRSYWVWWLRHRVPDSVRVAAALVVLAVLAGCGYLIAQLGSPDAGVETFVTTVSRRVTVRAAGGEAVRMVPVVRTVAVSGRTVLRTQTALQTITTPGGSSVVTRRLARPVVRREVVTNLETRLGTVTATVRRGETVTVRRTETITVPATVEHTITQADLRTVTREITTVQTVTQTVTTPLVIVTITVPQTP